MQPEKQFCSLCLSGDRKLWFSDGVLNIFRKYFSEMIEIKTPLEHFCFECINMLKKMEQFRKKVMLAQKLMNLQFSGSLKSPIKSLSTLSCKLITDSELIVKEEELLPEKLEDVKEEIKTETYSYEDVISDNMFEDEYEDAKDNIDLPIDKITETKKLIVNLRNPIKRQKEFEFVYKKRKNRYIEKKKIDGDELKEVMDKERNGIIYQSLKYKCSFENCLFGSDVKEKLNEHLKLHNCESGKYQCEVCKIWCRDKRLMRCHMKTHYAVTICKICGALRSNMNAIDRHVIQHLCVVKCLHCGLHFKDTASFKVHNNLEHRMFICDMCGKTKKSKVSLIKHIQKIHSIITCKLCGVNLKSQKNYRSHYNLKHVTQRDENAFCVLCDKQFDNVSSYKQHLSISAAHKHERKNGKKTFPCTVCGKEYARHVYMMNHWLYVHKNQPKFQCELCGKKCLNRTRYVQHKAYQHEGKIREKNKLCTICGRGFNTTRILTNHIRTHTGERPFECEFCPSKFSQITALKTHVKHIHMKAKRKTNWHQ